ncbi:hypothetical protein GQR36_23325 [Enterococcus termitis]
MAYAQQVSSLFSGEQDIFGKIIFEKNSHRILGAQLVSKTNILEKINTLALGIQTGQTIEMFYQKDFCIIHIFLLSWISRISLHITLYGVMIMKTEELLERKEAREIRLLKKVIIAGVVLKIRSFWLI